MPIVLSHQDVEALGSLAMNAGEVTGRAAAGRQDAALLANIDAQRTAQATQLQQIEASERQSQLDRDFRSQQAAADRSQRAFQFDANADFGQSRLQAGLQEAEIRAQAGLTGKAMDAVMRTGRDKLLHQQTLERIQQEANLGKYARSTGAQAGVSAGGFPNDQQIQQEIEQFGHLIPYGSGESVSAESAGRARDRSIGTAEQVAGMPTGQIQTMINERPDDRWNPFLRAVIEARTQAAGQRGSGSQSMQPEGRPMPSQRQYNGAQGGTLQPQAGAQGFSTPLTGLSDAQLQQLARDPNMLQQILSQGR